MIKIFLAIIALIFYESLDLYLQGIFEHPLALGILKIIFLNTILLMIVFINANILMKIKEAIPPILKTAAKLILTPVKPQRKIKRYRNCFSY